MLAHIVNDFGTCLYFVPPHFVHPRPMRCAKMCQCSSSPGWRFRTYCFRYSGAHCRIPLPIFPLRMLYTTMSLNRLTSTRPRRILSSARTHDKNAAYIAAILVSITQFHFKPRWASSTLLCDCRTGWLSSYLPA